MKRSTLSYPQRHTITIALLLLSLAGLLNGAVPTRRGMAAATRQADPRAELESKADPKLRMAYRAVTKARGGQTGRVADKAARQALAASLSHETETAGVEVTAAGRVTIRVNVDLAGESVAELKAAGFLIGSHIGDVATVVADVDQLPRLAALPSVERLLGVNTHYAAALPNDLARLNIGVDNASTRQVTETGKGVVVAVIDSGIDFRHPDFMVPGTNNTKTRIKFLLDQTVFTNPEADWDYTLPGGTAKIGKLYTEADINNALSKPKPANQSDDTVKQRDWNGHGTHVAGSAVGNGLGSTAAGKFAGMAHEADIIIIKASRANQKEGGFQDDDQLNSLNFIREKAAELNKPFVINMSLGGHTGPHDGSDPVEKAIDALVAGGAGRVVCVAAGNEGTQKIHAGGTLAQGASKDLTLKLPSGGSSGFMNLYYPEADKFSVAVTDPANKTFDPVTFGNNQEDANFSVENKKLKDGTNVIAVSMKKSAGLTWKFKITGDTVTAGGGRYDAWSEDDSDFGDAADGASHVGTPGTSAGAITVGAWVTRPVVTDASADKVLGAAASFSSPGPTRDNRQKPEISAPGMYVYSSKSADAAEDKSFDPPSDGSTFHVGQQGTSMATPVTSGAIALLLQAKPSLTSAEIKELLKKTATVDGFMGGQTWSAKLGFGKLNIFEAIKSAKATSQATVQFGQANFSAGEGAGNAQISVTRTGDAAVPVTVDYATSNGTASDRSDYTAARGTLRFAANETSKTIGVLLTDDLSVEGAETVTLTLSNPAGGALGAQATATLTITDNDTAQPSTNPVDSANFFVRQHYLDFLNREPDTPGLNHWTGQMTNCSNPPPADLLVCRINVSAAFFLSIEFQQTGYLVERMYKVAYGDATGNSTLGGAHQLKVPVIRLSEFLGDTQEIRQNVVVGQGNWEQQLETNKQSFSLVFVRRQRFKDAFPQAMTANEFVSKLDQNAGGVLTANERAQLVASLGQTPSDESKRAEVLRAVAGNAALAQREFNRAFVLIQYFGYLRRDPDAAPDADHTGYEFWLQKLDQFNGNFIQAEMVKAFLSSAEYRQRFGQ